MLNLRHELYGESVFTSFRTFEGKVFGKDLHLRRLYLAVKACYLLADLSFEDFETYFNLESKLQYLNLANPDSYIRLTIYSSKVSSLSHFKFELSELQLDIKIKDYQENVLGIKLKTESYPYSESYRPIKAGSYFQQLLLRKEALADGFDDVSFVGIDGQLLELSTSNIIFKNTQGHFITPKGDYFLRGTTLTLFENYCTERGLLFRVEDIKITDVKNLEAAFALNAVSIIKKIKSINSFEFKENDIDRLRSDFLKYLLEIS